jgi:hypothetical protein
MRNNDHDVSLAPNGLPERAVIACRRITDPITDPVVTD